jgi:hypothetical protein
MSDAAPPTPSIRISLRGMLVAMSCVVVALGITAKIKQRFDEAAELELGNKITRNLQWIGEGMCWWGQRDLEEGRSRALRAAMAAQDSTRRERNAVLQLAFTGCCDTATRRMH